MIRLPKSIEHISRKKLLGVACVIGLAALALIGWSLFDQGWIPVMAAMTAGQVLGTVALAIFVFVVVIDLRRLNAPTQVPPPCEENE